MTDYRCFCHSANVENLPLLLYGTNNHGNTQWKADREEFCPLVENNVLLSIRLDTVLHRLLAWSLCHGHFGHEELHMCFRDLISIFFKHTFSAIMWSDSIIVGHGYIMMNGKISRFVISVCWPTSIEKCTA